MKNAYMIIAIWLGLGLVCLGFYCGKNSVKSVEETSFKTDTIHISDTTTIIDTLYLDKVISVYDTVYIERDTSKVDYNFKYAQGEFNQTWMITSSRDSLLNMNAVFYPEIKYIKEKEYVTNTITKTNTVVKYRNGIYTGISYNSNFSNPMYGIHGGYAFSSGFILNGNVFIINQKDLYLGFGINKIW